MVYKVFKKSYLLNELQVIKNVNYTSNTFSYNFRRQRRLCLYTKRGRAVSSITRSSRHCFRNFARAGKLFGIKRYSW